MKIGKNYLNPSSLKKAAALKYDGKTTPKLTAKGEGLVAEQIISLAEENDVHIHYDPLLLDVLGHLELDDEIPETLYLAVAKIIAFAYYLQGKHPEKTEDIPLNNDLLELDSLKAPKDDNNNLLKK